MTQQAQLMSDFARECAAKGDWRVSTTPFWVRLLGTTLPQRSNAVRLTHPPYPPQSLEEIAKRGFAPFISLGEIQLFERLGAGDTREIVLFNGSDFWDTEEWHEVGNFKSRLLAELYFRATRDDLHIDEQEQEVLRAVTGLIQPDRAELGLARSMLYWTLVDKVLEDDVVTDEEQTTMQLIQQELGLTAEELVDVHREGLKEKILVLRKRYAGTVVPFGPIDELHLIAGRLGLKPDEYDDLIKDLELHAMGED